MSQLLSEEIKIVRGLAPLADRFAGTVTSDVVNMGLYERALFLVERAASTSGTGTQVFTVQASAANDGSTPTAVVFKYRRQDLYPLTDTLGAYTQAAVAGFTSEAGGDDMYVIEVRAEDLPEGKEWVHLKSVEGTNDPVVGSVTILLSNPRYSGASMPSAI